MNGFAHRDMDVTVTRRAALIGATALVAAGLPRLLAAQPATGALTFTELAADVALVSGAGANVAALATGDGLLLVDGGASAAAAALQRTLAERWPGRNVEILFNSNWREEHTGSNAAVRAAGGAVMAHENTKLWLGGDFFVDAVALAKRHGFMIIHDFAYGDVCFDGYQAPSFLSVPGAKDVGVETTTMSKGYNMAGWRIGFCAGNAEMVRALATIKGYYDYGIFQAIQIAAIVALRHCDELVTRQAAEYQRRRDVLVDGLRRIGWEAERPKAGMFVWARYPDEWRQRMGSIDFAMKLLEEAEVAVSPGRGFGELGEGYLRLALVENEQRLRQAVRQIGRCLRVDD